MDQILQRCQTRLAANHSGNLTHSASLNVERSAWLPRSLSNFHERKKKEKIHRGTPLSPPVSFCLDSIITCASSCHLSYLNLLLLLQDTDFVSFLSSSSLLHSILRVPSEGQTFVGRGFIARLSVGSTIDKTWVLLVFPSLVGLRLSVEGSVGSVGAVGSVGFAHHQASSSLLSLFLLPKKLRVKYIPKWAEGFAARANKT
jgi:hypothetical protein